MDKENKIPVNIWKDIERCWIMRLDLIFEGQSISGIHHSNFNNIIKDIDWLCGKLQRYKTEMEYVYGKGEFKRSSRFFTYIYIMEDTKTGYYKIGKSISPRFREKTLQAEKPTIIMLFKSPLTRPEIEKEIHQHFKEKRIRGEWFKLNAKDLLFIMGLNYGE